MIKYIILISISLIAFFQSFETMAQTNKVQEKLIDTIKNEEILVAFDSPPIFPGCEIMSDKNMQLECNFKSINNFIQTNLKIPEAAKKFGIEGKVFLRYVVFRDGTVGNIEILNDIGAGCDEAAKNVILAMNSMPKKWSPALKGGKYVNVYQTNVVVFRLNK